MLIKLRMKKMVEDKQPKHSVRYQFDGGDGGCDTLYLKRSYLPDPPPENLLVRIESA